MYSRHVITRSVYAVTNTAEQTSRRELILFCKTPHTHEKEANCIYPVDLKNGTLYMEG